jgi:hypothetical protein
LDVTTEGIRDVQPTNSYHSPAVKRTSPTSTTGPGAIIICVVGIVLVTSLIAVSITGYCQFKRMERPRPIYDSGGAEDPDYQTLKSIWEALQRTDEDLIKTDSVMEAKSGV